MSKELLLQQRNQVNPLQTEKELTIPDIEQEIECRRCNDIMALSSDFDRLYYFCEECNLSILVN
jgi:Zn finger protein HypA/HybF involved in hydrogenase expression